ncbi:hypothetical protein Mgra_00002890, partial [Meloidogyne graminicola]
MDKVVVINQKMKEYFVLLLVIIKLLHVGGMFLVKKFVSHLNIKDVVVIVINLFLKPHVKKHARNEIETRRKVE